MISSKNIQKMTREELIAEVTSLQIRLGIAQATMIKQEESNDRLRRMTKNYYQIASDYVPPQEDDHE